MQVAQLPKKNDRQLLAYFDFVKAFATFLRSEIKCLDAYGQSIWRLFLICTKPHVFYPPPQKKSFDFRTKNMNIF